MTEIHRRLNQIAHYLKKNQDVSEHAPELEEIARVFQHRSSVNRTTLHKPIHDLQRGITRLKTKLERQKVREAATIEFYEAMMRAVWTNPSLVGDFPTAEGYISYEKHLIKETNRSKYERKQG